MRVPRLDEWFSVLSGYVYGVGLDSCLRISLHDEGIFETDRDRYFVLNILGDVCQVQAALCNCDDIIRGMKTTTLN